ncbi:MAG: hypothetical protein ACK56C_08865 [Alphaproteobacteria bacterium]|jgi:protein TonB
MRATTKLVAAFAALIAGPAAAEPADEPIWARLPSPSQVLQAYPQTAKGVPGGKATINCVPSPAGNLTNCSVLSENPPGVGFGAAAVELAAGFRMTPKAAMQNASGIVFPIRFMPPDPAPPWRDAKFKSSGDYREYGVAGPFYPERAARYEVGGEVVMDCRVAADDQLKDCKILDVRPVDWGFDEAVVRMILKGWISAGAAPVGIARPADDIWRFKVLFRDRKGRFKN